MNDSHAVTRDQADRNKANPAMVDLLRHAQKKSGRHAVDTAREFFRPNRGRGKLTWPEYIQFGVYDIANSDVSAVSLRRTGLQNGWRRQRFQQNSWLSIRLAKATGTVHPG